QRGLVAVCCCVLASVAGCGGGFGSVTPINPGGGGNGGSTQPGRVTLTGTVKDQQTNLPLQGALVIFGGNRTATDADGKFALTNVSVPRRQTVLSSASATRRLQTAQTLRVSLTVSLHEYETFLNDSFSIQEGGSANVEVALVPAPGAGTFTGLVRESGTNRGVQDALVTIGSLKGRTDKDGRFQISGVTPGPQSLRAEASGYTRTVIPVTALAGEIVELPPIDLFKSGDLIPISGRVLDDVSHEGIVGATVRVGTKETRTVAGGVFNLNAPAGTQPVVVNAAGYESIALNVEIIGGLPPFTFFLAASTVEPPSTPFNVRGRVTDPNGNPVSGARVTALEQPNNIARDIFITRDDGKYRLFIAPAFYRIIVEKSGFQTAQRDLTVPPGGQIVDNVNFTLLPAGSPSAVLPSSKPAKRVRRERQ
ncbi:MAG: carboxypeptidase regulatory-like domain-containing protein, partial [Abditibacteriales bacterium]|nr:carboxypeptidase regulatory-like domain-containing protein [Abditibacteriales bacterium]MDW8365403.1 carboxypeptidase regulatory-like domain-containing protein [Abditibacteriales bacterium]